MLWGSLNNIEVLCTLKMWRILYTRPFFVWSVSDYFLSFLCGCSSIRFSVFSGVNYYFLTFLENHLFQVFTFVRIALETTAIYFLLLFQLWLFLSLFFLQTWMYQSEISKQFQVAPLFLLVLDIFGSPPGDIFQTVTNDLTAHSSILVYFFAVVR